MKALNTTLEQKIETLNTLSTVYQRLASVNNQPNQRTHKVFDNLLLSIDRLVTDIT